MKHKTGILLCIAVLAWLMSPNRISAADNENKQVRVGYYENEVFQEGAQPGTVKTGYAYEYYQKLSEYSGWQYEYVYGEFGDLYQMLLDGDIDFLTIIEKWLSENYSVDCVRSGMDALSYLERSRPDLILLDYQMPVMDGYKVMERIRLNPRNERIPIIFLTGRNDRESVMKILERRPDGYLLKSMPRDVLLDSLDRFFAGSILTPS